MASKPARSRSWLTARAPTSARVWPPEPARSTRSSPDRKRVFQMGIKDILLNGPLGFGTAPLGNMFRDIPDHEAAATVDAAWEHGTRFFDTAPMYGAGLAEIRLGRYLAQHDRDDYVLSTKVGRLVLDEVDTDEHDSEMFKFGRANRVVYDYSEKGTLTSIEGSLNRLGLDRLDFV